MGQQQLLLVILVTIIVGIATVVAINIFGTAADQANRDAVRQDLLAASVQAQAIYARPTLMNGAGGNFNDLGNGSILARLNIPGELATDSSNVTNENGVYTLITKGEESLTVQGDPSTGGFVMQAVVQRDDNDNWDVQINELEGSN